MDDVQHYARVRTASDQGRYARLVGGRFRLLTAPPWSGGLETGETVELADADLLCPVEPRKILGIGKNYRAHAEEMGGAVPEEPLVFTKLPTSLIGPDQTVVLPRESVRVDYEGELGIVIGKRARRVPTENALEVVFGYTALCDVTARDFQARDKQWTRAKGFDTFCPVGPTVVTGIEPGALDLRLVVNGETRQHGTTAHMVFDVAKLVAHVSSFCTLEPGDLIATGTPEGVGPLSDGDSVSVMIERIGELKFQVSGES
jgi:2-keto-4-pentenoate hydratase/2-oxohepta-3-ene-1,7-dioic acid hydratase in catechol pathway